MTDKIKKYNLNSIVALRTACDEAIPSIMESLGYKQPFPSYSDIRLAVGYIMVAISAACFYRDHQLGFEAAKSFTTACVVAFFVLYAVFMYFIMVLEGKTRFTGTSGTETISIATDSPKYDPVYHVTVTRDNNKATAATTTLDLTEYFNSLGHFNQAKFKQALVNIVTKKAN